MIIHIINNNLFFRISHTENRYYITDLGSINGSFVNGSRLSKPKTESEPREIGHGSVLQIGNTKLLCHVHPGRETCFECEPGLVQVKEVATNTGSISVSKASREKSRKKEMRELRKKYGLSNSGN
jgi:pSer/pThr/pTyr-binding forkhead associated (FHA) protein